MLVRSGHPRGYGKPASGEVALAGKDGKALAKLIRDSKAAGIKMLEEVTRAALAKYKGSGPLLVGPELDRFATSLAAVNVTADLLGRSRVREMVTRAEPAGLHKFADDTPLSFFAPPQSVLTTPEAALEYFRSLIPSLGIDPGRYLEQQRRESFTLAASTNQQLTQSVQRVIAEGMQRNHSVADTTARIQRTLDESGTGNRFNKQYSEMVYRTNAMDSFQTGMYEEGRSADVAELFPVWQYLGIDDERAGQDHKPKFNLFYPADAAFAKVRGARPFNCRCSMRWVDKHEWTDLQRSGIRVQTTW